VSNLGIGATYRGTYLQLTHGNPHRTYWGYPSIAAIEQFKDALKDKNSDLRDLMSTLTSFITDPALTLHREQRAGFHAGFVKKNKKKDPILDLLTQAAGKASRRP
jgi:hypothetical protein